MADSQHTAYRYGRFTTHSI